MGAAAAAAAGAGGGPAAPPLSEAAAAPPRFEFFCPLGLSAATPPAEAVGDAMRRAASRQRAQRISRRTVTRGWRRQARGGWIERAAARSVTGAPRTVRAGAASARRRRSAAQHKATRVALRVLQRRLLSRAYRSRHAGAVGLARRRDACWSLGAPLPQASASSTTQRSPSVSFLRANGAGTRPAARPRVRLRRQPRGAACAARSPRRGGSRAAPRSRRRSL